MSSIVGFDYALTHGALVGYKPMHHKKGFSALWTYDKKAPQSIPLKTPFGALPIQNHFLVSKIVEATLHLKKPVHIAIDFSAHTFFKAKTIQIVYQSFTTGYMYNALSDLGFNVYLVEPSQIRSFIGAKRNQNKLDVQQMYIQKYPYLGYYAQAANEDEVDAAILGIWLQEKLNANPNT